MPESSSFQTVGLKQKNFSHNILDIIIIAINALLFVVLVFINASASSPAIGIFKQQTGNISDRHPVDITPAGWTFSTWGIIYAWQGLWIVYSIASIFLKTDYGRLYRQPPVLTRLFFLFIFAHYGFNISWLFVWDAEQFGVGFGLLLLLTLSLYVANIISHINVFESELYLNKNRKFLWLYRAFVNNGLAFYATWVTIATALNLAIAWTYDWNGVRATASVVCTSFVAVIILVYFVLDVIVLEKFLRYTYSPYIQMFIAFAGVLSKNWAGKSPSAIFVLVLLILAGLMFVAKIIISIYRHKQAERRRNP